jgi:hypothetical protein
LHTANTNNLVLTHGLRLRFDQVPKFKMASLLIGQVWSCKLGKIYFWWNFNVILFLQKGY